MAAYDVEHGDAVHPGDPVIVDRYTAGARANHWITATCLVLLALSGLALFYPSFFFLTVLFGGGEWTRVNQGLFNLNVLSLAVATNGNVFASTNGSGIFIGQ